jgi:hypothetical protein
MCGLIVGLIGIRPGVGKDTTAAILRKKYGFEVRSFAERLYMEVAEAFGTSVAKLQDRSTKEIPQSWMQLRYCEDRDFVRLVTSAFGWSSTDPRSPREILRLWGTEYRRNFCNNPGYWFDPVKAEVTANRDRNWVLTDPRLQNELAWISNVGEIWRIDRPGLPPEEGPGAQHDSEVLARTWPTRFVLKNIEGHPEFLEQTIDSLLSARKNH